MNARGLPVEGVMRTVRRLFTSEEDAKLLELKTLQPGLEWREVAKFMDRRTARQCRERWVNYIAPVKSAPWSEEEDHLLVREVSQKGKVWSVICPVFGRSANDVKNRWYSHLVYRLVQEAPNRWLLRDPGDSAVEPRKKRNRKRVCAREKANELLENRRHVLDFQGLSCCAPEDYLDWMVDFELPLEG
jgi:hypothetical protein